MPPLKSNVQVDEKRGQWGTKIDIICSLTSNMAYVRNASSLVRNEGVCEVERRHLILPVNGECDEVHSNNEYL